jgi:flavin reductase (DIM6/NTAB) family NADH-FMN oxidoreductase RutF
MQDPIKLRKVAGKFATGITVISLEKEDGEIHGMTANSFLSVSLDPPLVLFSLKNNSKIFENIKPKMNVGISILDANMQDYSNHFAGKPMEGKEVKFRTKAGAVVLEEATTWYTTEVQEIIPAGDHHLIICLVKDLDYAENFEPLLYFNGYKQLEKNI